MRNHTEVYPQDERANKEPHSVLLLELMPSILDKIPVEKNNFLHFSETSRF